MVLAAIHVTVFRWLAQQVEPFIHTSVHNRLHRIEAHMALTDDALADLNDATNEVAAELDALVAQIAGGDAGVAAKVTAAADRLRGLAADPAQPVPPVEPAP